MEHPDIYIVEPVMRDNSRLPTYIDDDRIEFKKNMFDLEKFSYTSIDGLYEQLDNGSELEFKGSELFSNYINESTKNIITYNLLTCNAENRYSNNRLFIYEQLNSYYKKFIIASDYEPDLENDNKQLNLKAHIRLPWKAKQEKVNNKDEISKAQKQKNKSKLLESFSKEKARFEAKGYSIASNDAEEILYMVDILAHLPFEKCAIELSGNISVKITLVFTEDRILMLSKKMSQEFDGESKDDIFYSYFINRNMITSDVANFQNYITKFKEYIS